MNMLKFCLPILAVVIANLVVSILGYQVADDMWAHHMQDGYDFLENEIPENPSFPMWGYSFLAIFAGPSLPIYQAIFLLGGLFFWFSVIESTQKNALIVFNNTLVSGTVMAIVLLPFIALSVSYWSNSVFVILIILGAAMLKLSVSKPLTILPVVASGIFLGLAYNVRTEGLIFFLAFVVAIFCHRFFCRGNNFSFSKTACIFLIMSVSILPWYVYTNKVLEKPRIGTTNSAGVAYLSLGIRSDNPWGIEAADRMVWEIAADKGFASPWSERANEYFSEMLIESIKEYPLDFVRKMSKNIQLLFMQGVYLPNFRVFYNSKIDRQRLDYVNEKMKGIIGLKVNHRQLREYEASDEIRNGISFAHKAIVYSEFFLRATYALLFIVLNAAALILTFMTRFRHVESWFYLGIASSSILISTLFITEPRMTTMIVPFASWCIFVTVGDMRTRRNSGLNPSV